MRTDQTNTAQVADFALGIENPQGKLDEIKILGVLDVMGFDESTYIVKVNRKGAPFLTLRGEKLELVKMNLDKGILEVRGNLQDISFSKKCELTLPRERKKLSDYIFWE